MSAEGAIDENGEEYDDDDGVLELLEHYHIIHGTILAIRESGCVVVSLAETDYYGDGNLPYEQGFLGFFKNSTMVSVHIERVSVFFFPVKSR